MSIGINGSLSLRFSRHMENGETRGEPQFFFSLPRLIEALRGGSAARSDKNWLEANVVGAAMHGIIYLWAARWLLAGRPLSEQLLLLVALGVLLCLWWTMFFGVSSIFIKLLHALGLLSRLPIARTQGVLAGAMVTGFAWQLTLADSWMRAVGWFWLGAVSLNLLAALLLALTDANRSATS